MLAGVPYVDWLQILLAVIAGWFVFIAILFYLFVKGGSNPLKTVRWLYVVYFLALSAYLVFASPAGIRQWCGDPMGMITIGIIDIAIFILLLISYR